MPFTPPPQASAFGLTNLDLSNHFTDLSKVDVNDTRAPGFDFYPSTNWVGSTAAEAWNYTTPSPSSYSIVTAGGSNSVIQCNGGINQPAGSQIVLSTICWNGQPLGHNGKAWPSPSYFEMRAAFSLGGPLMGWFGFPLREFTSLDTSKLIEPDYLEVGNGIPVNRPHSAMIQWGPILRPSGNDSDGTANAGGPQQQNYLQDLDTNFHKHGWLRVPKSLNGGIGLVRAYQDDVLQTEFTYTSSDTFLDIMDDDSYPIFITVGAGGSVQIDWLNVWTLPSPSQQRSRLKLHASA